MRGGGDERRRSPRAVVVGAASRDVAPSDPRGWRLGGGVSYGALTMARLGLPTGALIGVDEAAATAWELDLLRSAGVDVRLVRLDQGPVFENREGPGGRTQVARGPSDAMALSAVPDDFRSAPGWLLAPVAAELPEEWAGVPAADSLVALGWQGLLREIRPDGRVARVAPARGPIVGRAELVGVSRDDLDAGTELVGLAGLLAPKATLVVTRSAAGGFLVERVPGRRVSLLRYPAVPAGRVVDPTGAGDVFLATLTALRLDPSLIGGGAGALRRANLLVAAAAASLVVEEEGLLGVPDRARLRARIQEARAMARPARPPGG